MRLNERAFEEDITAYMLERGGFARCEDAYDAKLALYPDVLTRFVRATQPREWKRFCAMNAVDPVRRFCVAFSDACDTDGVLYVLRHGFKHRGIAFRVCYFKPESTLNETDAALYAQNIYHCVRQWHYSPDSANSVDVMLSLNGIPLFAFELKDQLTGQTIEHAMRQWKYDRKPTEPCFRFDRRILAYFCVDLMNVTMTTQLAGADTVFLPFDRGSNGAGNDGGAGNPAGETHPTGYLWQEVFTAESMTDILQKFISRQGKRMIFPRYHQLDVVRKLIADVRANGTGRNYLIQHSAGSGKSNSIAWTAYRLASLHDAQDRAVFAGVIVVTDRTVLDQQLQNTIAGFDHTLGTVEAIGTGKNSGHLRDAINAGARIIVTTLQKFPEIYDQVNDADGRRYAIICDEAHSSQNGSSAMKLKTALADLRGALNELAELEGVEAEKLDPENRLVREMLAHGRHANLSFFAFTATPKNTTLETFGTQAADGSFHPFHIYSMRQAIEEGFIMDVLRNYMTYETCFRLSEHLPENPEVPTARAAKVIRKYRQLHPENIGQKSEIIVETFLQTTRPAIGGKGKMMVVTESRPAAVLYFKEICRIAREKGYGIVKPMVAFTGDVTFDDGEPMTEESLNVRPDGSRIRSSQIPKEFHDHFNILIVADKYQTGFDEPLLHTMIVDKKLRGVKTVQTLSRLNRTCPGKTDTFVLDFANKAEDVAEDFRMFCRETSLQEEVNTDLIYKVQRELREYRVYDDADISAFAGVYFAAADRNAQGSIGNLLVPARERYLSKSDDDRYQFRRKVRSFCKWYGYVSTIVRMFDRDLHKEYAFCLCLSKMIGEEAVTMAEIESMLRLEQYSLEQTFSGAIQVEDAPGVYEPAKIKNGDAKGETRDLLEEIIRRINDQFGAQHEGANRVVVNGLIDRLRDDPELVNMARSSDHRIFMESVFPHRFENAAQENYVEQQEVYQSLFEDAAKYKAIMSAVGETLYTHFAGGTGGR